MISLGMVTIDTPNPLALANWWAMQLGGEVQPSDTEYFYTVAAPGVPGLLGFQHVDDPTPGKNRLHLDFNYPAGSDRLPVIAAFVAAGATHLERHDYEGFGWDRFEDPDGNQFCVGDPH